MKVSFTEATLLPCAITTVLEPRKTDGITITISELLECAKEMKDKYPGDYCYNILQSNIVKAVEDGKVVLCQELSIAQTVNIVGMVGSGKSTFIKVLSYWANKNDRKLVVVLDTVAEVFNLWRYFHRFGVNCSPLVGRNERLKYINQITEETLLELDESKQYYKL